MLKVLGNRVLIKLMEKITKTKTGILLPDEVVKESNEGIVVAIGTGRVLDNGEKVFPEVVVGETVMYTRFSGSDLDFEGTIYKLLNSEDIVGVKSSD